MADTRPLDALFPGPRRSVFCALYSDPERWWSLSELAGRAGLQAATLRHHLNDLCEAGVLRHSFEGGRLQFQPNPGCPVHAEIRAIVNKLTPAEHAGAETILVVEDQPATAQITRILLESWGYRVLEAHDSSEALSLYEQEASSIHLLLTDVIMPGMTGPELAEQLTSRNPQLRVVFMSGYPSREFDGLQAAFLPKPFNPASLSRMVRKALDINTTLGTQRGTARPRSNQ
jgi:CheY-like chemotaxis protein